MFIIIALDDFYNGGTAYVASDDCFFDLQDRREVTRPVFNAVFTR